MSAHLRRSVTFPQLVLYGLGTMVGAGFYALTGKVAGEAGMATPLAFAAAGLLALLNAFTFAELSSRFPSSAGEARYVEEAFGRPWLAALVGWLVIATGVVSAGTLSVATAGFLRELVAVPEPAALVLTVVVLGGIAAVGVGASVRTVAAITIVEVGALLLVLAAALPRAGAWPARMGEVAADALPAPVLAGAFLAFYAFVGFEDMVNMAEEVREVRVTLPRAILLSVVLTTALYVAVALAVVMLVPIEALAGASTPLALVVRALGDPSLAIVLVSLLAGVNGALVQIVMAARVGYGLARRGRAPAWLGAVHARTRTPLNATALATGLTLVLALLVPLVTLARATSAILLAVFALLNAALWRLRTRAGADDDHVPRYPLALPIAAFLACTGMLVSQLVTLLAESGGEG